MGGSLFLPRVQQRVDQFDVEYHMLPFLLVVNMNVELSKYATYKNTDELRSSLWTLDMWAGIGVARHWYDGGKIPPSACLVCARLRYAIPTCRIDPLTWKNRMKQSDVDNHMPPFLLVLTAHCSTETMHPNASSEHGKG